MNFKMSKHRRTKEKILYFQTGKMFNYYEKNSSSRVK